MPAATPRGRRPRGHHRRAERQQDQRHRQGALDGVVVDAHGDLTDRVPGVPALSRYIRAACSSHGTAPRAASSQQRGATSRGPGPHPLAVRDEQQHGQPPGANSAAYPSSCHSRPAAAESSSAAKATPRTTVAAADRCGRAARARNEPADEHGHEDAPARLEHDRPVGIPGDGQVDQPEARGRPARSGRRAPAEDANRRMITRAAGRMPQSGAPQRRRVDRVGVPGDPLVGRRPARPRARRRAAGRRCRPRCRRRRCVIRSMSVATNQARSAGHHRLALCSAGSARGSRRRSSTGPRISTYSPARQSEASVGSGGAEAEAVPQAEPAVAGRRRVPGEDGGQPGRRPTPAGVPRRGRRSTARAGRRCRGTPSDPVIEAHSMARVGGAAVEGGDLGPGHVLVGLVDRPNSRRRIADRGVEDAGVGLEDRRDERGDGAGRRVARRRPGAAESRLAGVRRTARARTYPENGQPPGCSAALPSERAAARGPTGQMSAARGSGDCPVLARRRTTDGRSAVAQTRV